MKLEACNIESLICFINNNIEISTNDKILFESVSKQIKKSIALTDRQYNLMKKKVVNYKENFNEEDFNLSLETLKMPLRTIDRIHEIYIEQDQIVIKFPFNKKIISQLAPIISKYRRFYTNDQENKLHKFFLYESLIYDIVELFKNKKFKIDPWLIETAKKIEEIKQNEKNYVAEITDNGLINLSSETISKIEKSIGKFNKENAIKYWDRSIRYGYKKTAKYFKNYSSLVEAIANRTDSKIYVHPSTASLDEIAYSIKQLDRFPLLVTLTHKKELEEFSKVFEAFSFISADQQILLNRISNEKDVNWRLNSLIKEKGLNNWLDENIKIVYIFKNDLPKLLVKNSWRPLTHLSINGEREYTATSIYIKDHCDLNIILDSQPSYWNTQTISKQLNRWP